MLRIFGCDGTIGLRGLEEVEDRESEPLFGLFGCLEKIRGFGRRRYAELTMSAIGGLNGS